MTNNSTLASLTISELRKVLTANLTTLTREVRVAPFRMERAELIRILNKLDLSDGYLSGFRRTQSKARVEVMDAIQAVKTKAEELSKPLKKDWDEAEHLLTKVKGEPEEGEFEEVEPEEGELSAPAPDPEPQPEPQPEPKKKKELPIHPGINLLSSLSEYISESVDQEVEEKTAELRAEIEALKSAPPPPPPPDELVIKIGDQDPIKIPKTALHKDFQWVVRLAAMRLNILMVGPTGCGKTHLAGQVAGAIGRRFHAMSLSQGISEAYLLGRYIPSKDGLVYYPSKFAEFFRDGGLFLLDELDAADANALLVINSALANGHLTLPTGEVYDKHEDFILVATANTFGNGANRMYSGRTQLDTSTLDRFVVSTVSMNYDTKLEAKLADPDLCRAVKIIRHEVEIRKFRRAVSTRFLIEGTRLIKSGVTVAQVIECLWSSWSEEEIRMVMSVLRSQDDSGALYTELHKLHKKSTR